MGTCMTVERQNQNNNNQQLTGQHNPNMLKQDPLFIQSESKLSEVQKYQLYQEQGLIKSTFKKQKFDFSAHQITLNPKPNSQYQLPQNIVEYLHNGKSKVLNRESKREKEREIMQATQYVVRSSGMSMFSQDQQNSSLLSSFIDENGSILDIITSQGSQMFESAHERELLTSKQFKQFLNTIQFIPKQPAEQYQFLNQLGKSSTLKVFLARSRRNPSKVYAVRIIPIKDQTLLEKFKEQIAVMTLCQSHKIIKYYFTYYFDKALFMFIQYMNGGSLHKFIMYYGKILQENIIAYIIRQILKGLYSIHSRRQVHRDLKSDNILINRDGDIKIADFGFALQFTKGSQSSNELAGTPAWMAPELILRKQCTQSIDIWSLGIILVELCQGQPKYVRMNPYIAMIMIATKPPETVEHRSPQLQRFLDRCLKKDPRQRATAIQLLEDPFILGIGPGKKERNIFLQMLSQIPNNLP